MKLRNWIWCGAAAAGLGLASVAQAGISISFSAGLNLNSVADFHSQLNGLGAWINLPSYGECWHPTGVAADWRPYEDGTWVWTDAGWYWQSDEAWAPECYHYGSWVDDPTAGWAWIPGTEWAPAWVTWRYSDNYVGWAPCGPHESAPPDREFCFVDVHHFNGPIRRADLIVNNRTILARTHVIHSFPREARTINGARHNIVTDPGPSLANIQRASGHTFQARPIAQVVENERQRAQRGTPQARSSARTENRVIREPAGARTPTETPQRRMEQNRAAEPQHTVNPAPERRAEPNLTRENGVRQINRTSEQAPRAAQERRSVEQRSAAPVIREPAGAQRRQSVESPRQAAPERVAPAQREQSRPETRQETAPAQRSAAAAEVHARPNTPAQQRKDQQQPPPH